MILCEFYEKNHIRTEIEERNFSDSYDLIIVGLGTAGAIAAIKAGRLGLKVLGIEHSVCMGGLGTGGGVLGYYGGNSDRLGKEMDEITRQISSQGYNKLKLWAESIHPEVKKYVYEQEAIKENVVLKYNSRIIGVFMNGKSICGIRWIGPDGICEAKCKVVIDCSGDADVAFIAGCDTKSGRSFDGQCQPFSTVSLAVNKDNEIEQLYLDAGYVDVSDGTEISNAIIEGYALHIKDKYNKSLKFLSQATYLGIREGRNICGEESITFKKYLNDEFTKTPILYATSSFDMHGCDTAFESDEAIDWSIVSGLGHRLISVPISINAMIPKGYEGIINAGRCIDVDHDLLSVVRMKHNAMKMGEVAAISAYVSIKRGIRLLETYPHVISILEDEKEKFYPNSTDFNQEKSRFQDINTWPTKIEYIEELMSVSDKETGIGIWAAKRMGKQILNDLKKWVNSQNQELRINSAFALSLMGEADGLPVLRTIVEDRISCEKKNSLWAKRLNASVYLLGKFKDVESFPIFKNIIREDISFQLFSYVFFALIRIGQDLKTRVDVAKILLEKLGCVDTEIKLVLHGLNNLEREFKIIDRTDYIRIICAKVLDDWGIEHDLH